MKTKQTTKMLVIDPFIGLTSQNLESVIASLTLLTPVHGQADALLPR
jgi:hypothetical protein